MSIIGDKKFTFTDIPKFYRIPISCYEDHFFLNVGKNSVVKIHENKPLHTWTLTHPNYFTCPVVYCNENLYSVINSNVLIKWSVNEDNLKNAEKIKFQESIFTVIPVPGRQPLVLLKSGKYATVDGPQPQELALVSEDKEIVWADVSHVDDNITLFFLVCDEIHETHTLYSQQLNCDDKSELTISHPSLEKESLTLNAWCLNGYDSSFLSVWSDGNVLLHKDKAPEVSNIIHFKECESISNLAVTFIDAAHIGIALQSVNQRDIVLEIWDTKFSVMKAKKNLKISSIQNLQIASKNSDIFIYSNKEVSSFSVHLEPSTLAAAMGKSLPESSHLLEYCWGEKGELLENPPSQGTEPMDISENQEKCTETIEIVAKKLLTENAQYLMYIPEYELAKLLLLVIRHCQDENIGRNQDAVLTILNIVFSASFNDIYLVKYLKRMNLEDTLITLELLLSYLNEAVEKTNVTTEKPSDFQIINWTCLLIQSHMEALLLSKNKNTRKLLRKLEKAVCVKTEEYEDYEDIQNYFTIIQKKQMLPEKCSVGKYFIETLDI